MTGAGPDTLKGVIGADWGVYGVPETFVIDSDGAIAYKHIGPFTQAIMDDTIVPLIRELQARGEPDRPKNLPDNPVTN